MLYQAYLKHNTSTYTEADITKHKYKKENAKSYNYHTVKKINATKIPIWGMMKLWQIESTIVYGSYGVP